MFVFSVPEYSIVGHVHLVTRKAVGITQAEIVVFGKLSPDHGDVLYADNRPSMPAIDSLSAVRTENALEIDARNIRDYDVRYRGAYGGMSLSLAYRGLMDPFDPHDPLHNPRIAEGGRAETAWDDAYKGHFDLTCRVTGSLELHGRSFEIDCVEAMDHSWGPRREIGQPGGGWMHAHFGEELAISWINRRTLGSEDEDREALAYGYVLDRGEATGLVSLKLRFIRVGWLLTGIVAEALDAKGRTFLLQGTAISGGPVRQYNHVEVCHSLMRWVLNDGRIGHGMVVDAMSFQEMAERNGRLWADQTDRTTF
ncbi:MAG: hypothetical protein EOP62_13865 [Sphingomonadales bacterium]|nr:MAG: hypothetical protein EOP62_13865 [Sphingomonadales bacterium]